MKYIFIYILLLSNIASFAGPSRLGVISSNRHPKYGMIGFSGGLTRPFGGGGHLFDEDGDQPHGEFGFLAGFDYWKRYFGAYDFHVGLESKYEQYHFHYGENQLDGYFRLLNLSIPVTIHFPLKSYPNIALKGGFALSCLNFWSTNKGSVGDQSYITEFKSAWPVYPELIIGVDFLEESGRKGFFRAGIDYSFVPVGSMGEFGAFVTQNGVQTSAMGSFSMSKIQLKITLYPTWKQTKFDPGLCPGGG